MNIWMLSTTLPDGTIAYWDYKENFSPTNLGAIFHDLVDTRRIFGEVQRANPEIKIELREYKLISIGSEGDLPTSPIQ